MKIYKNIFFTWFVTIVLLFQISAVAQENWYPSRYGAEDTLGAVNNMSLDIVRNAAGLITTGKVYSLAMVSGPDAPLYPSHRSYQLAVIPRSASPSGEMQITGFDDFLVTWMGIGTQMDGLGHVGINYRHYNGIPAGEMYRRSEAGLKKLGIQDLPPIVTRGILLDMAAYYGVDTVPDSTAFGSKDIQAAADREGVEIRKGDVVLLHSGWLKVFSTDPVRFIEKEPGLGAEGARYLAEKGIVAVGADTGGVEVMPAQSEAEQGGIVHALLLAHYGVYLLENVTTQELAADGVHEFLFVLGVPRLQGAVQSIIHPIAIH